jgi:LysR family transcriptional regulator for metE and metH
MDLEVRHLRLVVAVADHRSLTRAGEELHLTQSALSHQLRGIEDRLGAQLFVRHNRRMLLTPAGERLLETARAVLGQLQSAEDAIRDEAVGRRIPLRVSTECYTVYHWLPGVLCELRTKFPHVEIRIDVESTERPLAALLDGKLDVALVSGAVRDRRVVSKALFQDELVVVMHPGHRLAAADYVRPADFRQENLLIYVSRENSYLFQHVLVPSGVEPASIQRVQLTEAMIELVKAGLGIAVLARWALRPYLETGAVRAVPLTPRGLHRDWHAVIPRALAGAPHIEEFLRLLLANATPGVDRRRVVEFSRAGRRR